MAIQPYNLIVTAHPDDEALFFSGLILQNRTRPWTVVCVTDGNADGRGSERTEELKSACEQLGVTDLQQWRFPDLFEKRLSTSDLEAKLESLSRPEAVYTHGILGEYGHPHHQDVSYSVHQTFSNITTVRSLAYNIFPDLSIALTEHQFQKKSKIITEIYQKETLRFLNFIPILAVEGFCNVNLSEVTHIYDFFTGKCELNLSCLEKYNHLGPYLQQQKQILNRRPF